MTPFGLKGEWSVKSIVAEGDYRITDTVAVIVNAEGEEIIRTAQRRAILREEEIIKEAEATAERIIERAGEEIALERRRAVNEIKDEVSAMAIGIAEAVIKRDISAEEHKDLIDSFIDNMGDE